MGVEHLGYARVERTERPLALSAFDLHELLT
jgi:hypothetical protein